MVAERSLARPCRRLAAFDVRLCLLADTKSINVADDWAFFCAPLRDVVTRRSGELSSDCSTQTANTVWLIDDLVCVVHYSNRQLLTSLTFCIIYYQESAILNWSAVCDRLKYFQPYALRQAVLKLHLFHTDWTIFNAIVVLFSNVCCICCLF